MQSCRMNPISSGRGVVTLLLMLAIYVLSFGPSKALYASQRLEGPMPSALATFYKPVTWLYQNTPLGKPMAVHDDWWQRRLKRA